jgi:hypothetical protein|tara:strand:- start:69 stop:317 length:249 start_codon:yes stop_codon:yes gene_type:complete
VKAELIARLSMEDVAEIISVFAPHISVFKVNADGLGEMHSLNYVHAAYLNGASIQINLEDEDEEEEEKHWSYQFAELRSGEQ